MQNEMIKKWRADRDAAIRSLDVNKVKAFFNKYSTGEDLSPDVVLEITMRKMLYNSYGVPLEERQRAAAWLKERGYTTECDEIIKGV